MIINRKKVLGLYNQRPKTCGGSCMCDVEIIIVFTSISAACSIFQPQSPHFRLAGVNIWVGNRRGEDSCLMLSKYSPLLLCRWSG